MVFEDAKADLRSKLKIEGGASIVAIENEAWKKSGAKTGFVITSVIGPGGRFRVSGADALMSILNENKGEEIVVLGLYPNGQEFYFEVKVD